MREFGAIAVQEGGRVMPIDSYARRLAADVTGREHWGKGRGPDDYSNREAVDLLAQLLWGGQAAMTKPLLGIENKPFKTLVGLDPERKFFSAAEIASCKGINDLLGAFQKKRDADPQAQASKDERRALDLFNNANRIAALCTGESLAIVPSRESKTFLAVGLSKAAPGTEGVQAALQGMQQAYVSGTGLDEAARALRAAIAKAGTLTEHDARSVSLELFYNLHDPWTKTQVAYALAMILFGLSRLMFRKPLVAAAIVSTIAGVLEHMLGISLRVAILERAPVSNTFEALLWMGLVGIAVAAFAQAINRRSYYLFGGVCAAFISVIFAGMVPLTDRTNSLPAVLRSNYWLTVHVLTVVASYGVFAVGAILGHVYLIKEVLLAGRSPAGLATGKLSHPLIAQAYRTIQVGLLLLTAGTILGGVWAADSWGRFWGWDPKETWALISILVYFTVLHARYIGWLRDFGLAAASVLGFVVIVWTFYGVNYVMATGLHSYGFGAGGEIWVASWALAELVFLIACRIRFSSLSQQASTPAAKPA
jgi:cytochrome c-type biogenesis protein CcsB